VKHSLEKPHSLKANGAFKEQTRTMTHELAKVGVPMEQVGGAVKAVAQGFGINIDGCISSCSVGCITLEGGLAAQLQTVHEIDHAPGKLKVLLNICNNPILIILVSHLLNTNSITATHSASTL
jgi:hypothetical protein